jgi:hypothetical protein
MMKRFEERRHDVVMMRAASRPLITGTERPTSLVRLSRMMGRQLPGSFCSGAVRCSEEQNTKKRVFLCECNYARFRCTVYVQSCTRRQVKGNSSFHDTTGPTIGA